MPTKREIYLKGAREFLCGRHIADYGRSKQWQDKARQDGDKAMRMFLFGSIKPGYDVINKFQTDILKDPRRLELIEEKLAEFTERCEYP